MAGKHPTSYLPGYVLEVLAPGEQQAVHAHVEDCPQCRAEVADFRASLDEHSAGEPFPRPHIRQQLRTQIALDQARTALGQQARQAQRAVRVAWAASLAGLAIVIVLGFALLSATRQNAALALQIAEFERRAGREAQVTVFLADPGTASRPFPATVQGSATQATLYMRTGHNRVVVFVDRLQALDSGHTYQLWLAAGNQQVPASVFRPQTDGSVAILFDAPAPIDQYSQVMVTVELRGGAQHPSDSVVLAADL